MAGVGSAVTLGMILPPVHEKSTPPATAVGGAREELATAHRERVDVTAFLVVGVDPIGHGRPFLPNEGRLDILLGSRETFGAEGA